MSSAPITMPLFGQSTRSPSSLVSAVIVSPQFGCVFAAWAPFNVRRPSTVKASAAARKVNTAAAAWSRSLTGMLSPLSGSRSAGSRFQANLPQFVR